MARPDKKTTSKPSPMLAQYWEIKAQNPDCILFFRMGDFYEMFFDDAKLAAPVLNITLTSRGNHNGDPIPMAGVPVHAAEQYLPRLIRAGHRVAICEQTENPAQARARGNKSIVNRAVVRIITSGTLTEDELLDSRRNNYLCAVSAAGGTLGIAWADISTGECFLQELGATNAETMSQLAGALARIDPGELLCPEELYDRQALAPIWADYRDVILPLPDSRFDSRNAEKRICDVYKIGEIGPLGDLTRSEIATLGALIDYASQTQVGKVPYFERPRRLRPAGQGSGVMEIDAATRRNLELTRSLDGESQTSLIAAIDRTTTSAGARLLAQRVGTPLTDIDIITARLDMVSYYFDSANGSNSLTADMLEILRRTPDVERALSRLDLGRGGPRDLAAICAAAKSGENLIALHKQNETSLAPLPHEISEALENAGGNAALIAKLETALGPDLPLLARDGGFIADGYHAELDLQRKLRDESRKVIAALQKKYADQTGVTNLKIKHNNVLGYFIEVTPTQADKLTDGQPTFFHRQTLASASRFTTTELAELVEKITLAADQAQAIEMELFAELVAAVVAARQSVAQTGRAIAELDVALGLATLAVSEDYCRPEINAGLSLDIQAGRHPVVEKAIRAASIDPYIPNDCVMSEKAHGADGATRIWLLTGPNMAGKSTFLRQNAVIIVMAQMGSFVPAASAHIGVVDRVFSRVGAADDLARGRSTFMVEMVETATILSQATPRSFVILDEIGRGTSTFDGLSIAWAVMEHLHDGNKCRTVFATHYHELTSLAERLDALSCHTMRVREWKGNVVFLHEVANGSADRSYGIHVAELAGLPENVVARSKEILTRLEASEQSHALRSLVSDLPLFQILDQAPSQSASTDIEAALGELNLDDLSPREALDTLYRLRDMLDE